MVKMVSKESQAVWCAYVSGYKHKFTYFIGLIKQMDKYLSLLDDLPLLKLTPTITRGHAYHVLTMQLQRSTYSYLAGVKTVRGSLENLEIGGYLKKSQKKPWKTQGKLKEKLESERKFGELYFLYIYRLFFFSFNTYFIGPTK